jgi:hypothetical protein
LLDGEAGVEANRRRASGRLPFARLSGDTDEILVGSISTAGFFF